MKNILSFFTATILINLVPLSLMAAPICESLFHETKYNMETDAISLGLKVEHFDNLYRYDSRSPGVIAVSGFQGNPKKPLGSILEHSKPGSHGTANYISFTVDHSNSHMLRDDIFIPYSYKLAHFPSKELKQKYLSKFNEKHLSELRSEYQKITKMLDSDSDNNDVWSKGLDLNREIKAIENGPTDPLVFVTYEYSVEKVLGVDTSKIGINGEKEVITEAVPPSKIKSFRKVYWIFEKHFIPTWVFQKPESELFMWCIRVTLKKFDLEYGTWEAMPSSK